MHGTREARSHCEAGFFTGHLARLVCRRFHAQRSGVATVNNEIESAGHPPGCRGFRASAVSQTLIAVIDSDFYPTDMEIAVY